MQIVHWVHIVHHQERASRVHLEVHVYRYVPTLQHRTGMERRVSRVRKMVTVVLHQITVHLRMRAVHVPRQYHLRVRRARRQPLIGVQQQQQQLIAYVHQISRVHRTRTQEGRSARIVTPEGRVPCVRIQGIPERHLNTRPARDVQLRHVAQVVQ